MVQFPKEPRMENECRNTMANIFGRIVVKAFIEQQGTEAMQRLSRDMRVEAFVVGVLTGAMSTWLQASGLQHYDTIVESTIEYVPFAAEQARIAIEHGQQSDKAH